uniref:Uncharacterized protein n=1 Tax=viral metagenome TaxID=1070528 RepID=A0A6C0DB76_9ZZZZ
MPKNSSSKNKTKLSLISRARSASMALAGGTRRKRGGGMEFPSRGVDIHFGPGSYVKYDAQDYKLPETGVDKAGVWRPPNHLPGNVNWWKTITSENVPVNKNSGDGYYTTVDTTDKTSPGASLANAISNVFKGGRRKRRGGKSVQMDFKDGGDMKLALTTLNSDTATAAAAAKGSLAANSARLSCCPTCPKIDITPPSAATSGTSASATSTSLNANATGNATVGSSSSIGAQAGNFLNSVTGFMRGGAHMGLRFNIDKNHDLIAGYKQNPHVEPSVSDGSSPCCPACPKAPIVAKGGRRKRGGQLELINTALVPGTLLYMQNKYSKKKGFSKMLPKFGGKTRRRRHK